MARNHFQVVMEVASRGQGFALEVGIGQPREDRLGFGVETVEVREDGIVSIGEITPTAGVTTGPSGHRFSVHIALDAYQVPQKIAEREGAGAMTPFELSGEYTGLHDAFVREDRPSTPETACRSYLHGNRLVGSPAKARLPRCRGRAGLPKSITGA